MFKSWLKSINLFDNLHLVGFFEAIEFADHMPSLLKLHKKYTLCETIFTYFTSFKIYRYLSTIFISILSAYKFNIIHKFLQIEILQSILQSHLSYNLVAAQQAGKDATYTGIIIAGVAVTGN